MKWFKFKKGPVKLTTIPLDLAPTQQVMCEIEITQMFGEFTILVPNGMLFGTGWVGNKLFMFGRHAVDAVLCETKFKWVNTGEPFDIPRASFTAINPVDGSIKHLILI